MIIVRNINALYTMQDDSLGIIRNAAVVCHDDVIAWVGAEKDLPDIDDPVTYVDAKGCVVIPGLIDCHTHLVFAGTRRDEFAMRARGISYAEIMQAGGGIMNTVRATRQASVWELADAANVYLDKMMKLGVTSIEAKTGYGLSVEHELKMVDVYEKLNREHPIDIFVTLLAAHAIPPEFSGQEEQYIDVIIHELLPEVAKRKIVTACDIFVEKGAFCVQQAKRLLIAARENGLRIRIHAEQLSHTGGAQLASELKATSAGHLEFVNDEDIAAMSHAGVIGEVLPIALLFLGLERNIPAKKMLDASMRVAIGTDFNPGSAMSGDLQLAARLAVTHCKMPCEQALLGITKSGADVLGASNLGFIRQGAQADLCVLDTDNIWDLFYDWSRNPVRTVIKKGRVVQKD